MSEIEVGTKEWIRNQGKRKQGAEIRISRETYNSPVNCLNTVKADSINNPSETCVSQFDSQNKTNPPRP